MDRKINRDVIKGIVSGVWYAREFPELTEMDPLFREFQTESFSELDRRFASATLGRCARLFEEALDHDNLEDRVQILKVASVALDAEKYELDVRKAVKKFNFDNLCIKYGYERWCTYA